MKDKDYYSIKDFCVLVGISRPMFYERLKDGTAPNSFKFGGKVLISKASLLEWQQKMEIKSRGQANE